MKKIISALFAAVLLIGTFAFAAAASGGMDISSLPENEFSVFDRKKYQDEEKYYFKHYDSLNNAVKTTYGLVPDEEKNMFSPVEGYDGFSIGVSYFDKVTDLVQLEQYAYVYYPETTALYESVVTNAPAGTELYITIKDGAETKRTEREARPLDQTYGKNIIYNGVSSEDSRLSSSITVIYHGALDLEWKEKVPVSEKIAKITEGRVEGREIMTNTGRELPDSYTELTVTKLDEERTMYTLYSVKHDEYDYVYEGGSITPTAYKVPEKRFRDDVKEDWHIWTVYQPKEFPEIYFTLESSAWATVRYEAPFGHDEEVYRLLDNYNKQTDEVVNTAIRSIMTQKFTILATNPYTRDGVLIDKDATNWANNESGEDDGVSVPDVIVLGSLGLTAALAAAAASGKKRSSYKMTFMKDFGDTLDRDGGPVPVYARMIEVLPNGFEVPRDDLTEKITAFSYDNSLEVRQYGMKNGYMAATVRVPSGSTLDKAAVSFKFTGEGGTFTRNIVFKIDEARIVFMQENLGLPAGYDKVSRLPFVIVGFPDNAKVSAHIKNGENEDVYDLTLEQDGEYKTLWRAVISEKPKAPSESGVTEGSKEAGTTEGYQLHVTAETGVHGKEGYLKKETDFPIYRIWLGLSMVIESTGIGCYMRIKPSRVGVKDPTVNDIEPCMTEASLMMLDWDEENHSIVRAAVIPKTTEKEKKENKGISLKVTPKKVGNDRYAHTGDATQDHQDIVDALGIKAFPTGQTFNNGAHKLLICSTKGALDPPTRMIAEIEMTVEYKGRDYTVKKDVLLRSQELRTANSTEEAVEMSKRDDHIQERLLHIQSVIWNNYMDRLFSLYNLIDRMVDGYDPQFGYDENQVNNVMDIWTAFLQGKHTGANGETEKLTFADELKAAYAFMQGLRDNTGILGRIAMGVMTAGYSEYVFTTMTLGEEMYEKVMSCKGDEEFGCWDAVVMCVKEFEKQVIMEYATAGLALGAKQVAKETGGVIDVFKVAEAAGAKYRSTIDKWDQALCGSSKAYKAGAEALKKTQNYFNSLARGANKAISESAEAAEQAAAKAEQKIVTGKKKLSPSEMKAVEEYDLAMAEGLKKVQKLKEAQQKIAKSSGAEKELARQEYRRAANEVWTDKNALKQLQRSKDPYAQNMRYQFNQYREGTLNRVEQKALDDISREWGIPREELYVSNATSNQNFDYYNKIPGDRDSTFNRIVQSDRSQDISLSQDWGEKAMARNLYKEINGVDAPSIEEALRFMKAKDVTYVCPEGSYYMNHVIEPNMDAYADLGGMIGLTKSGVVDKTLLNKELKGLALNQKTVAHKGKEWFTRDANESYAKAAACEKEAAALTGAAKEAKLGEARAWRYTAQGQKVEGVRQITKQFDKIIDVRNTYSVGRGNASKITPQIREIHAVAKRVGDDIPPAVFEKILAEDYGLTLDGYADLMADCLV